MGWDESSISDRIERSASTIRSLADQKDRIAGVCAAVRERLAQGAMIFTCGNGGSAAQAMHLAEELMGKFRAVRPPFAAVCLNADPTTLTCIANDFGFEQVFARQVEGLGRPGDCLISFSTSGASRNVALALEVAAARDMRTIGLLGRDGGHCVELCDQSIVIGSEDTALIQEAHQVVLHLILEALETKA